MAERMTVEEFQTQEMALLDEVPPAFRSVLSSMAEERGHSAGHEEVINILSSLVFDLKPAIAAYREELRVDAANA